jgi:hypothetical protein
LAFADERRVVAAMEADAKNAGRKKHRGPGVIELEVLRNEGLEPRRPE